MRRVFASLVLSLWVLPTVSARLAWAGEPLRVATFQADVTPPLDSPLCNGYKPCAQRVDRPLTARGVVLMVGPSPIVLCAVDWVVISNGAYDAWREALAKAAGTTVERVVVHCVHPHDAPGCDFSVEELLKAHGLSGKMFNVEFARVAIARTAEAVRASLGKAQPVTHLGMGQAKVEKVASNRRILGPDGKVKCNRMSACGDAKIRAEPEGLIDRQLRALSFWNGDRPVAYMSYYATHPQCNYGRGGISSEVPGVAREIRERALPGVAQIYFTGAAGNVAMGKYNDGSAGNRQILGRRLAEGMAAASEATKRVPITAADVEWRVRPVALPLPKRLEDEADRARTLGDAKAKQSDRVFAARDLAYLRRVKAGRKLDVSCLRLGPAYVLHMPGELCIEYQLAAQKMRPDDMVCMAAYADLSPGYICPKIGYSQGGYEAGRVSRVSPEVEGVLMTAMRELLRD
ncbi:MAG: hypothetical protein JXQ73_32545 [Phycisphaerae bacterium]|nr:hypothetical protein [Phycisphaerae bacterium]